MQHHTEPISHNSQASGNELHETASLSQAELGEPGRGQALPRVDFWNNPRPTNENPNFVRDYFQSSRLHFIGSFRARYESMMVAIGKRLGVNPSVLLQKSIDYGTLSGKRSASERVIVHIDMDAFFASIAVRDDPSLAGHPVAVCHAAGEISSCTYEARAEGVRAGMFLRDARKLCPSLRTVAYDFAAYQRVSVEIYSLFFKLQRVCVEAVSVDEAYVDLTLTCASEDIRQSSAAATASSQCSADDLVRNLRDRIFAVTGCTASAGIGPSKLVARLATKAAKPNGQFRVRTADVSNYMDSLSVRDLPGIGWRTARRLADLHVTTVPQLRAMSLARLQGEFGDRQGITFHDYARAIDTRPVEPLKPRKSIGAEVSWGVRFLPTEGDKVTSFITEVAAQVFMRVSDAGAYGSRVTYKVYKRIRDADKTGYKHLGHGPCSILTRSARLPTRVGEESKKALVEACLRLHADLRIAHDDFRGVGIQVGDLTFADLKFDYVEPIAGTRRIETFFRANNSGSSTRPISQTRPSKETGQLNNSGNNVQLPTQSNASDALLSEVGKIAKPKSLPALQRQVPIEGEDLKDSVPGSGRSKASNAETGKDPADDCEIEVISPNSARTETARRYTLANSVTGSEDEGQKNTSSTEDHRKVSQDNTVPANGQVNLPHGWDHEVFLQLPKDIQEEQLKQTEASGYTGGRGDIGRHHVIRQSRIDGGVVWEQRGRAVRNAWHVPGVPQVERRAKRRKGGAQVTMTQFAELARLRRTGTDVVDAAEFCERPLRECVELLEDLKGPVGMRSRVGSHPSACDENLRNKQIVDGVEDDLEIPSPPSLSSDSEPDIDLSLDELVEKLAHENTPIYADEPVWTYATDLADWMRSNAQDLRSAHIELLRGRLLEMLHSRLLQRLCEELRTIARFAQMDGCASWIVVYNHLLYQVQQECFQLNSFHLNIPRIETSD